MAGVLYHTKSNNKRIKEMLDNPLIGRALIKKIMLDKSVVEGLKQPTIKKEVSVTAGEKTHTIIVTELGYDLKVTK